MIQRFIKRFGEFYSELKSNHASRNLDPNHNKDLALNPSEQLPLYNRLIVFVPYCDVYREFIGECLESIAKQYYLNYEVVIVDDGSRENRAITEYAANNDNCFILRNENNLGPAGSKYKFIEYIQNNRDRYSMNDIAIVVDGDDKLLGQDVFNIVNSTYLTDKCWMTTSDYEGRFSENIVKHYLECIKHKTSMRKAKRFTFPHLRTFKLGLLTHFDLNTFKYKAEFIPRCSDVALFLHLIELCGYEKISFINQKLYFYREHTANSYKTVDRKLRNEINDYLFNLPSPSAFPCDIHLVLATYRRSKNLRPILDMLVDQTVSNIHLHIIDNNEDAAHTRLIDDTINDYRKKLKISLIRNRYNYSCISRFYFAKKIAEQYLLDYVIIFDDDQIYESTWLQQYIDSFKPLSIGSWYGKIFQDSDYWDNKIKYGHILRKEKRSVNRFKCFGPGGCILDASLFGYSEASNFDNYSQNITAIDDIWLSFVYDKLLNVPFNRILCPPVRYLDKEDTQEPQGNYRTFLSLQKEKNDLFNFFIDKFDWKYAESETPISTNSYFDMVYVLVLEEDTRGKGKVRKQLSELNINALIWNAHNGNKCQDCIEWVDEYRNRSIHDKRMHSKQTRYIDHTSGTFSRLLFRSAGTLGIIRSMERIFQHATENRFESILVFQEDVLFDKHFAFKIDKHLRKLPKDWEILNLGSNQWNWTEIDKIHDGFYRSSNHTYGSFAQAFKLKAIKKIIPELEEPKLNFDLLLATEFNENYYTLYPNICIQDLTKSSSGMAVRDLIANADGIHNPEKLRWKLDDINYKPYWDVKVLIFATHYPRELDFNYLNFEICDFNERARYESDDRYCLYIDNNEFNSFDTDLVGNLLEKMKTNNSKVERASAMKVNIVDKENYDLFCKSTIKDPNGRASESAILFDTADNLLNYEFNSGGDSSKINYIY